jgi:hypothetical protein
MRKTISLSSVTYQMVLELSNKTRKKPGQWIEETIKNQYEKSEKKK